MNSKSYVIAIAFWVLMGAFLLQIQSPLRVPQTVQNNIADATKLRVVEGYGKLPLSFEGNQGQADAEVKFLSRGSGWNLFLTSSEAVLSFKKSKATRPENGIQVEGRPVAIPDRKREHSDTAALRMKLAGSNPTPTVTGLDELPGKSNYFIGDDPSQWRSDIATYAKVRYEDVYPGVNLTYYGNQRQIEYDFEVAAGADPKAVRLDFDGQDHTELDRDGNLILQVSGEKLEFHHPEIYQEVGGRRQPIEGGYVLEGEHEVSFEISAYDQTKPLIIDPIVYSTYLGGIGVDYGNAIAVDASGSVYVCGTTGSTNFPTTTPISGTYQSNGDVFVAKINPAGSALVYSTYLGGADLDEGFGIAVDASGSAYIAGDTDSPNFPRVNPIQSFNGGGFDVFVARLNASGSALVYSTTLGGSGDDGAYSLLGQSSMIAVDSAGNAVITGFTASNNFPIANAYQRAPGGQFQVDAFVTKLNPTGTTLIFSTYLGGTGLDIGIAVAMDASGNVYITGSTASKDFPLKNAAQGSYGGGSVCGTLPCTDAFVTEFTASGSDIVYSTYLGGSANDEGHGIAVDASGNTYVTGYSVSGNFPVLNPFQKLSAGGDEAFVTKFRPGGSMLYSSYLGGTDRDRGLAIAVDNAGNVYVAGRTASQNFPVVNSEQVAGGDFDGFISIVNPSGTALLYSTYLGGLAYDSINSIAVDSAGNVYVTGNTESSNFPTRNPLQRTFGSLCVSASGQSACNDDAFVTKLIPTLTNPLSNPLPVITSISPSSAVTGGPAFTLVVNGSNFVTASVVRWNGSDRTTKFDQSTQLEASILASDIQAAGTAQVTVFNSAPGGGLSGASSFTISGGSGGGTGGGTGPTINSGGTVNGASFATGAAVAPGSIASVFGNNLFSSNPGGVSLRMNNISAFLFADFPGQINFQVPWELAGQTQALMTVTVDGVSSSAVTVPLATVGAGIFKIGQSQGAILIASSGEVVAPIGSISGRAARPANRGEYITIYCTGLGAVTNQPGSGQKASDNPLSATNATPTVTIGGVAAPQTDGFFSGLAPGFVGLYQVNVQVPQNSPTGDAVPLTLSIGGVSSNTVTIAVQ